MTATTPSLLHLVTILTYCSLHGAQPIQPLLAGEFQLSHFRRSSSPP